MLFMQADSFYNIDRKWEYIEKARAMSWTVAT